MCGCCPLLLPACRGRPADSRQPQLGRIGRRWPARRRGQGPQGAGVRGLGCYEQWAGGAGEIRQEWAGGRGGRKARASRCTRR